MVLDICKSRDQLNNARDAVNSVLQIIEGIVTVAVGVLAFVGQSCTLSDKT